MFSNQSFLDRDFFETLVGSDQFDPGLKPHFRDDFNNLFILKWYIDEMEDNQQECHESVIGNPGKT